MPDTPECKCNLHRLGLTHEASDAEVWAALEARPGFNEAMEMARQQYERGEFVPYREEPHDA